MTTIPPAIHPIPTSLSSSKQCPICKDKISPGRWDSHYRKELKAFTKNIDKSVAPSGRRKAAINAAKNFKSSTSSPAHQSFLKLKASRLKRQSSYSSKSSSRPGSSSSFMDSTQRDVSQLEQSCFLCGMALPKDIIGINAHIDACLADSNTRAADTHSSDDHENASDGSDYEEFEEYTWAGQKRVRATTGITGGFESVGFSVNKRTDVDIDGDVDIDADDEFTGQVPFGEDVLEKFRTSESPGSTTFDAGDDSVMFVDKEIVMHNTQDSNLVIDSLKQRIRALEKGNDGVKCLICLEGYTNPCVSVACWHVHCETCWMGSLGMKRVCPQCQVITAPSELRRIWI